jgi:hypothetical protein
LMLVICLIHRMPDHKHDLCFYTEGLLSLESLQNRLE